MTHEREPHILWVSTIWIYISESLSINLKSQHAHFHLSKSEMCFLKLHSITISPKDSCVIDDFWAVHCGYAKS